MPDGDRIVLSLVHKRDCRIYQEDWQGMSLRTLARAVKCVYASRKGMALRCGLGGKKRQFNGY